MIDDLLVEYGIVVGEHGDRGKTHPLPGQPEQTAPQEGGGVVPLLEALGPGFPVVGVTPGIPGSR